MKCILNLNSLLDKYEHILFDLDNTIYNQSDFDYIQFYTFFRKYFDDELAQEHAERLVLYKEQQPYGHKTLFNDYFSQMNLDLKVSDFVKSYRTPSRSVLYNSPSLKKLLLDLKDKGKHLYLITNGYRLAQNIKIDSLGIREVFDDIHILDPNKNLQLKPSSDVCKSFNFKKKHMVFVGDNKEVDGVFAKNCSIDFIHFIFKRDYI